MRCLRYRFIGNPSITRKHRDSPLRDYHILSIGWANFVRMTTVLDTSLAVRRERHLISKMVTNYACFVLVIVREKRDDGQCYLFETCVKNESDQVLVSLLVTCGLIVMAKECGKGVRVRRSGWECAGMGESGQEWVRVCISEWEWVGVREGLHTNIRP